MTELHSSDNKPECSTHSYYRPEDIQEMFGIKRRTYYARLNHLGIVAHKDEQGKPYLDDEQVDLLEALDKHISETGKMEGFNNSHSGALVKSEQNGLEQAETEKPTEDIYVSPEEPTAQFDLDKLVREAAELKAREIAIPDLVKRAVADRITEEDLPEDLKEKVNQVREAANPKFTPAEVADTLLSQWRSRRGN